MTNVLKTRTFFYLFYSNFCVYPYTVSLKYCLSTSNNCIIFTMLGSSVLYWFYFSCSITATATFLHWLVGMLYVFYFAAFIMLLREVGCCCILFLCDLSLWFAKLIFFFHYEYNKYNVTVKNIVFFCASIEYI